MAQVQLMHTMPVAGRLGLSRRIASSLANAATERAADVEWDVRAQVAAAFYATYDADAGIAIANRTLLLLEDIARTAQAMYRVGAGQQTDVLRAQVAIARMREDIARMEATRTAAAARLNALLDRPFDAPIASPVLPSFPAELPALDSLVRLAMDTRPMIRAGRQDVGPRIWGWTWRGATSGPISRSERATGAVHDVAQPARRGDS